MCEDIMSRDLTFSKARTLLVCSDGLCSYWADILTLVGVVGPVIDIWWSDQVLQERYVASPNFTMIKSEHSFSVEY